MELKKLVKNTSYLAGTSVFDFLAGVIRAKINAIILGPTGIGIVNQLSFMSQKMSQFTMLSMSEAVTKQIAENKDKPEIRDLVSASIKSYVILVLSFMLFSTAVFLIFSEKLTAYIFGDLKYIVYFYVGLFSIPIFILNSIPFAILKGLKDIKSISIAKVGIIITNLVVFIPLVLLFKLKGAVIFLPVSYLINLSFNYFITRKKHLLRLNISFRSLMHVKMKKIFVKELFLFSGFGLIIGSYSIFSEFVCRTILIDHLGIKAIGLYRPIIAWSALYVSFLIYSFSTYLFPRFAETKSNKEATGVLNDAIRLSTLLLYPMLFIAIPYRNLFLKIFYSTEFLEAGKYLPYHFIGVIFYIWWYILTQSMTPTGKIKQHALFMFLYFSLDMAVTLSTVPRLGLYGWMLKYIISPVVFFIIYYLYLYKKTKFRFTKSNILIMLYLFGGSIFLTLGMAFRKTVLISYVLGPSLLLFSWFLLKRNERNIISKRILFLKNLIWKE